MRSVKVFGGELISSFKLKQFSVSSLTGLVIFLSGMSALVYQVVSHKYFAILLGSQARATSITLAIFLGGLGAGYLWFGQWVNRTRRSLFLGYAVIELTLAVWIFFLPWFAELFLGLTQLFYGSLGVQNVFVDLVVAFLVLALPTFLMGGTLPVLTQALSSSFETSSRTHALIYGWNTVGACAGTFAVAFWWIPEFGLAGAVRCGALLNLFCSLVFFAFWWAKRDSNQPTSATQSSWGFQFSPQQKMLLGVAFLSGFYVFTLETVLIRLMGLSTGSAGNNFSIVIGVFIFGLGFGALLLRHISQFQIKQLLFNQLLICVFLCLLYLSVDYWSYGAHLIRISLRDNIQNYWLYQGMLAGVLFTVLIVPVALCGMTLPICYHLFKDESHALGQRVGHLYGFNTVGSVLGAILGGYVLFYWLNLDQMFKLAIAACLISCVLLSLSYLRRPFWKIQTAAVGAPLMVFSLFLFFADSFSREAFVQPFRYYQPIDESYQGAKAFHEHLGRLGDVVYHNDGPNTTVAIGATQREGKETARTIFVNGKSDGNTKGDLMTTVLLGHLPGVFSKEFESTCVIGLGTGITVGELTVFPEVKSVDVVEISPVMIQQASQFDRYNRSISQNPKVRFLEMDALRYLGGTKKKYDAIVSEPSNPWVTGVENLYTEEFYEMAERRLQPGGVFVQWIHTYSFNEDLLRLVLKTMETSFPYIHVFQLRGRDIALVGTKERINQEVLIQNKKRYESAPVKAALKEADILSFETLLALEVIPPEVVTSMAATGEVHQITNPSLSRDAAKAFFTRSSVSVEDIRRKQTDFYWEVKKSAMAIYLAGQTPNFDQLNGLRYTFCDQYWTRIDYLCEETLAMWQALHPTEEMSSSYQKKFSDRSLASLKRLPELKDPKIKKVDLRETYRVFEMYKKYYSPIAQLPMKPVIKRLEKCVKQSTGDNERYGECLVQRILFDVTFLSSPEIPKWVAKYKAWFSALPKSSRYYEKHRDIQKVLEKMDSD